MAPAQFVFSFGSAPSPPPSEEALKVIKDQARPAADVARILDEAQVPNILWGGLPQGLVARWDEHEKVSQDSVLGPPVYPVPRSKINCLGCRIHHS